MVLSKVIFYLLQHGCRFRRHVGPPFALSRSDPGSITLQKSQVYVNNTHFGLALLGTPG